MTTVMADTVRQLTCAMFCAPVLERFLLKFPNTISHHTVNKLYNPHLYGEWGGAWRLSYSWAPQSQPPIQGTPHGPSKTDSPEPDGKVRNDAWETENYLTGSGPYRARSLPKSPHNTQHIGLLAILWEQAPAWWQSTLFMPENHNTTTACGHNWPFTLEGKRWIWREIKWNTWHHHRADVSLAWMEAGRELSFVAATLIFYLFL